MVRKPIRRNMWKYDIWFLFLCVWNFDTLKHTLTSFSKPEGVNLTTMEGMTMEGMTSHIAKGSHASLLQGAATAAFVWIIFNLEREFFGSSEGVAVANGVTKAEAPTAEDAAADQAEAERTAVKPKAE